MIRLRDRFPHEEVKDTAEVPVVIVVGEAPLQVAMQGHCIEVQLKRVPLPGHRGGHDFRAVCASIGAQTVGLPVHDIKAPVVLENEVNKALQPSAAIVELQ